MFEAIFAIDHWPRARFSPRMLIWYQPITRLMMPNTGSTSVQRSTRLGAQPVGHLGERIIGFGPWRFRCKGLEHRHVVRLALHQQPVHPRVGGEHFLGASSANADLPPVAVPIKSGSPCSRLLVTCPLAPYQR